MEDALYFYVDKINDQLLPRIVELKHALSVAPGTSSPTFRLLEASITQARPDRLEVSRVLWEAFVQHLQTFQRETSELQRTVSGVVKNFEEDTERLLEEVYKASTRKI